MFERGEYPSPHLHLMFIGDSQPVTAKSVRTLTDITAGHIDMCLIIIINYFWSSARSAALQTSSDPGTQNLEMGTIINY